MKLATPALLKLTNVQIGQLFNSMFFFRKTLNEAEQKQFDLAFEEIKSRHYCSEFDGMGMRLMTWAVVWKAKNLVNNGNLKLAKQYTVIAETLEKELARFQAENNPLKRIEAQTAGTVHAS
ncbi:hypothetical protein BKP37_00605 [Anaerobacillus alkalilacustris]|uniref:Uncharacterized protein n=1 Tax=Anaerobacillus alkalilacustris TaxID=393763 RepID=A0A1S2LXN7_9BACI|nr:hypothetical protein [Anaerobacillus alkalilacustris]OIJ17074.1 hypothetical protein BKP37_00605 [Anaerobacillus alkalilacustris]